MNPDNPAIQENPGGPQANSHSTGQVHSSLIPKPQGEQLYQRLFELMPGSMVLMDARGFIMDANPAFCRQIGYPRETLQGMHVSRFSKDSTETIERNLARPMAGDVPEHQVTNIQQDGSLRYYDLKEAAITLPDGSRGVLALANDVTSRLRAEAQKLEMERKLFQSEKLQSLGALAGGIAHEYNNFLATIVGNLDLAMMDSDAKSPIQSNLREAAAAALRATNLTQQMLAYSGQGRVAVKQIDLSALIEGMEELLKASISKKASVRLNLAAELPFIAGDDQQLQQALMNLVTNASDALGERPGLITLTTQCREYAKEHLAKSLIALDLAPGAYVELEVRDTGRGMDETVLQRLFDPFFTTKATSLGLGMSVVMGAVRSHKGAIYISSQPHYGTTISLLFPVAAAKPAPVAPAPRPPAKLPATPPQLLTGTVLVVEDEAPIRLLMERIFKRQGLRVLTATDGQEAIVQFRQHADEITFVILDFMMPKLDGMKTLVELRRIQPKVKAVLTSGYNVDELNQHYAQEGFAAFIQKPFQVETLMKVARQLCPKT